MRMSHRQVVSRSGDAAASAKSLHHRGVVLLRSPTGEDFRRTLFHPEQDRTLSLEEMLVSYARHGEHHIPRVAPGRDA